MKKFLVTSLCMVLAFTSFALSDVKANAEELDSLVDTTEEEQIQPLDEMEEQEEKHDDDNSNDSTDKNQTTETIKEEVKESEKEVLTRSNGQNRASFTWQEYRDGTATYQVVYDYTGTGGLKVGLETYLTTEGIAKEEVESIHIRGNFNFNDVNLIGTSYPNVKHFKLEGNSTDLTPKNVQFFSKNYGPLETVVLEGDFKKFTLAESAFEGDNNLKYVDLSAMTYDQSLSKTNVFRNTINLEEVKLPSVALKLGKFTFMGAENLHTINSEKIASLGEGSFNKTGSKLSGTDFVLDLTGLQANSKVPNGEFVGSGVTEIIFPTDPTLNLSFSDDGHFSQVKRLKEVDLSAFTGGLGSSMFVESNIEKIILPKSPIVGKQHIFYQAYGLKEIENLEYITSYQNISNAFTFAGKNYMNDSSVNSVLDLSNFPGNMILQEGAFKETGFSEIIFPNVAGNTYELRSGSTFIGTANMKQLDLSMFDIKESRFMLYQSGVKELWLPNSLNTLGPSALYGAGIEVIHADNLERLEVNSLAQTAHLYEADFSKVKFVGDGALRSSGVSVDQTVNEINYDFSGLEAPQGVDTLTIGKNAFDASSLKSIILPSTEEAIVVGNAAFINTRELEKIDIRSIKQPYNEKLFEGSKKLREVVTPTRDWRAGYSMFYSSDNLEIIDFTYLVGAESLAFGNIGRNHSVEFDLTMNTVKTPVGKPTFGEKAFNSIKISQIKVLDGEASTIDQYSFQGIQMSSTLDLIDNFPITSMGRGAFQSSNLKEVHLTDGIALPPAAFQNVSYKGNGFDLSPVSSFGEMSISQWNTNLQDNINLVFINEDTPVQTYEDYILRNSLTNILLPKTAAGDAFAELLKEDVSYINNNKAGWKGAASRNLFYYSSENIDLDFSVGQDKKIGIRNNVGSIVFDLNVNLTGGMAVQWYKDDIAIPGETSFTLELENMTLADAGVYELRLSSLSTDEQVLYMGTFGVSSLAVTDVADQYYFTGESTDFSNITVNYTKGGVTTATTDYTLDVASGTPLTTAGTTTVTATYTPTPTLTATFDYHVANNQEDIEMYVGDSFTYDAGIAGVSVTTVAGQDIVSKVAGSTATQTKFDALKVGTTTVTLSYGGKTRTFDIKVKPHQNPALTLTLTGFDQYLFVGDDYDFSTIVATLNEGTITSTVIPTEFQIDGAVVVSGDEITTPGTFTVKVRYNYHGTWVEADATIYVARVIDEITMRVGATDNSIDYGIDLVTTSLLPGETKISFTTPTDETVAVSGLVVGTTQLKVDFGPHTKYIDVEVTDLYIKLDGVNEQYYFKNDAYDFSTLQVTLVVNTTETLLTTSQFKVFNNGVEVVDGSNVINTGDFNYEVKYVHGTETLIEDFDVYVAVKPKDKTMTKGDSASFDSENVLLTMQMTANPTVSLTHAGSTTTYSADDVGVQTIDYIFGPLTGSHEITVVDRIVPEIRIDGLDEHYYFKNTTYNFNDLDVSLVEGTVVTSLSPSDYKVFNNGVEVQHGDPVTTTGDFNFEIKYVHSNGDTLTEDFDVHVAVKPTGKTIETGDTATYDSENALLTLTMPANPFVSFTTVGSLTTYSGDSEGQQTITYTFGHLSGTYVVKVLDAIIPELRIDGLDEHYYFVNSTFDFSTLELKLVEGPQETLLTLGDFVVKDNAVQVNHGDTVVNTGNHSFTVEYVHNGVPLSTSFNVHVAIKPSDKTMTVGDSATYDSQNALLALTMPLNPVVSISTVGTTTTYSGDSVGQQTIDYVFGPLNGTYTIDVVARIIPELRIDGNNTQYYFINDTYDFSNLDVVLVEGTLETPLDHTDFKVMKNGIEVKHGDTVEKTQAAVNSRAGDYTFSIQYTSGTTNLSTPFTVHTASRPIDQVIDEGNSASFDTGNALVGMQMPTNEFVSIATQGSVTTYTALKEGQQVITYTFGPLTGTYTVTVKGGETNPTGPTDPTDPTTPIKPVDPKPPVNPVDPTGPTVNPTKPGVTTPNTGVSTSSIYAFGLLVSMAALLMIIKKRKTNKI